jgi:hypothetical protein
LWLIESTIDALPLPEYPGFDTRLLPRADPNHLHFTSLSGQSSAINRFELIIASSFSEDRSACGTPVDIDDCRQANAFSLIAFLVTVHEICAVG